DRRDDALLAERAAGKIVLKPRAQQRQRLAEGGAAVVFARVARQPEIGMIAILLAPARVIAGGEDMAVRRRAEPGILIGGRQRDGVEPRDFGAIADQPALRVAIAPAVA